MYKISLRGKRYNWSLEVTINKKYLQHYLDDGLDIEEVTEIPDDGISIHLFRAWEYIKKALGCQ
jgi:hypothetical protein